MFVTVSRAQVRFPFPQIPAMITDQQGRLAYMLEHFWDNYHFNDTTKANQDVAEQGVSDFVNLMQYADSSLARRAADQFVSKAFATQWGRSHYEGLLDHYLANPESPLRNDVVFSHLLRSMIENYPKDDVRRSRLQYRLHLVTKNQPGTKATDFNFETRQGKRSSLHKVQSPYTLLIFNDPECEHCHEIMPKLIATPALQDKRLKVLTVYPDTNTSLWKKSPRNLPANWIDVCSPQGEVMEKQLYHLPAMPSLYLLDEQKRVLVKDGTIDAVIQKLKE